MVGTSFGESQACCRLSRTFGDFVLDSNQEFSLSLNGVSEMERFYFWSADYADYTEDDFVLGPQMTRITQRVKGQNVSTVSLVHPR